MPGEVSTRVSTDLFAAAARESELEGRSASEQLAHWAQISQRVMRRDTDLRTRVDMCLAGDLPWTDLLPIETVVANAELDIAIRAAAERVPLGEAARADGITTVALEEDGRLREYRPDGTTSLLS